MSRRYRFTKTRQKMENTSRICKYFKRRGQRVCEFQLKKKKKTRLIVLNQGVAVAPNNIYLCSIYSLSTCTSFSFQLYCFLLYYQYSIRVNTPQKRGGKKIYSKYIRGKVYKVDRMFDNVRAGNCREREELPERSDAAANSLRGFGGGGWNFLLLILTVVQFLLAFFLGLGRLFDRLGGGRLRLQWDDRQSLPSQSSSDRFELAVKLTAAVAAGFLPTFIRPRDDSSPPSRPEVGLAGAGVTGAAGSSS